MLINDYMLDVFITSLRILFYFMNIEQALKERHIIARCNAPGINSDIDLALKGRNLSPFQG